MPRKKQPAKKNNTKKAARSFLGDLVREIAGKEGDEQLLENAALLDVADREALIVMATEGALWGFVNLVDADHGNQAIARLGVLQDPGFESLGDRLDALEIDFEGDALSNAVLEHRIAAANAGFLLGVSIGRRIGGVR